MRIPVKNPRIVARNVGGEAVAVNPDTATLHALNPTATKIWEWIDGKNSISELARLLSAHYGIDGQLAENDVEKLCNELSSLEILSFIEESEP